MLKSFLICLLSFSCLAHLHAQAKPTATRTIEFQVGGGGISAKSDYGYRRFKGFFGYMDVDFTSHLGGEFEIHQIFTSESSEIHERTYEIGARYRLRYGRLAPYAKLMIGRGVFNFPYNQANLAYNMGAVGLGADYRLLHHVNLRADYEYQRWFNFPNNGLTPSLISVGAAYHF